VTPVHLDSGATYTVRIRFRAKMQGHFRFVASRRGKGALVLALPVLSPCPPAPP
jgi:hypothetical protein